MDSTQAAPGGPRSAAGRMLWPALALAAIVLLASSAPTLAADPRAAEPAAGSPTSASANPVPAGAGAATPASAAAAAATVPADGSVVPPPPAGLIAMEEEAEGAGEPPTRVRIAILNATGKPGGANKIALLLSEVKRRALEDQIGLQIEVVNLSTAEGVRPGRSVLFYRPVFLRAALAMAQAIPGDQLVQPMRPAGLKRAGVDVEIVVGEELP